MRVMLDNNLWSSIGDEGVAEDFDQMMRARALRVVVPPSILLEVARLPVAEPRQRIIAALCHGKHVRPPSEAQSESMEVVAEIRKHRRPWLRTMPDTEKVRLLNNFWTNKIWRAALEDSQWLHDSQIANMSVHEKMLKAQRQQRHWLIEERANIRPLTALMATAAPYAPEDWLGGWSGQPVELWRIQNRELFWRELSVLPGFAMISKIRIDTTYADWVGAYVNLGKLRHDYSGFTRFWFEDVDRRAVPRNWLRWAVNFAQANL
jgi:hypothetical protein